MKLAPEERALFDAILASTAGTRGSDGNDEALAKEGVKRALAFLAERRKTLDVGDPS